MEAYLEALDVEILRAASQGFLKPRDATHLCLMAKGERKVSNNHDSSDDEHASDDDSDSDDEYESPTYD